MNRKKGSLITLIGLVMIIASLVGLFWLDFNPSQARWGRALPQTVSGVIGNPEGKPIPYALVQQQGTPNKTTANSEGFFTLQDIYGTAPAIITAWSEGHYVGWTTVDPLEPDFDPNQPVSITLKPLFQTDNLEYDWFSFEGVEGTASCGLCHREYEEWLADAHSLAAINPRFISIYRGTNILGEESQPIHFGSDGTPLPPDSSLPYYGSGYRLDNPQRAGNCATCHTPVASKISNANNCGWSGCHTDITAERAYQVDEGVMPVSLTGDAADGISCDFCHKIGDVILDPQTNLPFPDMPGILSYRLYRPEEGQEVFFGTVMDVNRRVSYLPLQSQSEYCAPCHYGVFGGVVGHGTVSGGVVIYNSYGEWLDSPYSDLETGETCQDCHMPVSDANYFVFPEKGGIQRDYVELHNHTMPGASDVELLQNSVSLSSSVKRAGNNLYVEVSITNDRTGHHIPTDVPIRQMILVLEVINGKGDQLQLTDGPVLPDYAGDLAAYPGKSYAKVLKDEWTGEAPTAAYWRPVAILEDTRLAAFETDITRYVFELTDGDTAQVRVRLIFRRAFQEIAELKGWDDPDILMEEEIIEID
jgi:hypothetical protein